MDRANNGGAIDGLERGKSREASAKTTMPEVVLRVLALLLTLVAAIILAVDKQTKIVPVTISPNLPPFNVPVVAKSSYLSAFVYFVIANSIACAFAAITLVLSIATKGRKGGSALMVIVLDLIMVVLLFSAIGAAGGVGLIGYEGNTHLRWNKVCNVYGIFCNHAIVALVLSFLGALAYFLLLLLTASKLQKRM